MKEIQIFDNGAVWNGDIKFFIGVELKSGKVSRRSKYFTNYADALYQLAWLQENVK